MEINKTNGNDELLRQLGLRLKQARLNLDWTQGHVAELAGVGVRTVRAMEAGASASMDTWLSVLRALGRLDQINQFLPAPPPSPIQLAKLRGKYRQRASGTRGNQAVSEDAGAWTWGE